MPLLQLELVRTADGLTLPLAYFERSARTAILATHGVADAFYSPPLLALGQYLHAAGYPVALLENRGHALVTMRGRQVSGASYERFEDCWLDLHAAATWLRNQGHEQVVLLGHSLGALKVTYTYVYHPLPGTVGLALCSPPRLPPPELAGNPEFEERLALAERLVAEGRAHELLPRSPDSPSPILRGMFSAGTFVDKYTPTTRSALLRYADQLSVAVCLIAGHEEPPVAEFIRRLGGIIPDARVVELPGADHFYTGQVDVAGAVLTEWLSRVAPLE